MLGSNACGSPVRSAIQSASGSLHCGCKFRSLGFGVLKNKDGAIVAFHEPVGSLIKDWRSVVAGLYAEQFSK
jgi:hypothetical protein